VVDGEKVKKFTAAPNEVSIVDNPCVPSACFSMFKADGSEEQIPFKVENDDDQWPAFSKAEADQAEASTETPAAAVSTGVEPTNDEVVKKAEELAKAANDGTTWMQHVETARTELMKGDTALGVAVSQQAEAAKDGDKKKEEAKEPTTEGAGDTQADDDTTGDDRSEKVTPAGVKQAWVTSDGQSFDKKADAVSHEEALEKKEPTEAEKLKARLEKATSPDTPETEVDLLTDYDRLGKAVNVLETINSEGFKPDEFKKGMYTVSRFANVLWDLGSLTRKIAKEGITEGGADGDPEDKKVSTEMKTALASLGESFKTYVDNQITELLAGIDDDVVVECYDYYYAAAKEDGEDQLAKDVCSLIDERRDVSRERRETLGKSFGMSEGNIDISDELSPVMQKRFESLEKDRDDFKKIAEDAVGQIEVLTKRVQVVEQTPLPRAPNNIAFRPGDDGNFFGKSANTPEEKMQVLQEMLTTMGPDALALELIKTAHQNGRQLHLQR
jgi:hypothetical protein